MAKNKNISKIFYFCVNQQPSISHICKIHELNNYEFVPNGTFRIISHVSPIQIDVNRLQTLVAVTEKYNHDSDGLNI